MKWLIASRNRGKIRDFQVLFDQLGYELVGLDAFEDLPEVVEDGDTFEANAVKKAVQLHAATGLPTLGDDSGLVVDALDGEPGVYSARYAGEPSDDDANNRKLLKNMEQFPDPTQRSARFVCMLAVCRDSEEPWWVEGRCEGRVGYEVRGSNGFGYDPLFEPMAHQGKTMAELSPEQKAAISHRGNALRALYEKLSSESFSKK